MQLQFLAPVEFFLSCWTVAVFDPGGIIIFFIYIFSRACFVMSALVSRVEHETVVEGRRLGTVHIMEGTCSRLRFFVRSEQQIKGIM